MNTFQTSFGENILALSPHFLSPLDRSISVCDVVGFVCVSRVLLLDEQRGRFDSWSVLVFSQSQLYLGELAVCRLRSLIHAGCHDRVLILLPGHLSHKMVRSAWMFMEGFLTRLICFCSYTMMVWITI